MIEKLLKQQVVKESGASASYMAAALWARNNGLFGCEKFLKASSKEEAEHRDTFLEYLADIYDCVTVEGIVDRKAEYKDIGELFAAVLKLEIDTTKSIHELYNSALGAKDFRATALLLPFLDEQLSSEREIMDIIARLKITSDLSQFDKWIGEK